MRKYQHIRFTKFLQRIAFTFIFAEGIIGGLLAQTNTTIEGWKLFKNVKFTPKYIEEFGGEVLHPFFTDDIKAYEGRKVRLKGYVMPFDYTGKDMIVLSRFPYDQCFFCGMAGPETVAEVYPTEKITYEEYRKPIIMEGVLELNDHDIQYMNFILREAYIVDASQ
ncbi:hypothetical protein V6R21_24925 [Limibacter armeniacum]|uniref:hypothetical protein n=1 Tax=Limibacter armeniacum TaxID=466084 RepID=UPI002FE50C2F